MFMLAGWSLLMTTTKEEFTFRVTFDVTGCLKYEGLSDLSDILSISISISFASFDKNAKRYFRKLKN